MGNFGMSFWPLPRRQFLKLAAGAAAGAGPLYWGTREKIRLGLIGAGQRGHELAKIIYSAQFYPVYGEIVAVCDVDREHAERTRQKYCSGAEIYEDYRKLLARDDIRAVFIVTPDHWHTAIALAALRAGKAVYCEKPLTLTIAEGQQLVRAVQETGGIFQVGTQQRSSRNFQTACELVRNGRLGKLQRITITLPEYPSGGPFSTAPVPPHLNWDSWLGPAPWVEYCPERCHYHYRSWFEYSGGAMTDWGAHHLDIAHWAMGVEQSGPLSVEGHAELPRIPNGYNTPSQFTVDLRYPHDVRVLINTSKTENGILFEGNAGRIFVNRGKLTGKPVEELASQPLPPDAIRLRNSIPFWGHYSSVHVRDFFDCVRTGKPPISDVVSQHRSVTACHLSNISMRLGRKIRWDAARETILGDPEANGMLSRPQRASPLLEV
jgi:predicted dehydrogenase